MIICVSITCIVSSKYSDQLLMYMATVNLALLLLIIYLLFIYHLLCRGGTVCNNITNNTHTNTLFNQSTYWATPHTHTHTTHSCKQPTIKHSSRTYTQTQTHTHTINIISIISISVMYCIVNAVSGRISETIK